MKDSIFIRMMGDYPIIRVLNFLLIFREYDYSLTDIARESDVAWSTLNNIWPGLEKMKIVMMTRTVGKAKMYKLNAENILVRDLIEFADKLIRDHNKAGKQIIVKS